MHYLAELSAKIINYYVRRGHAQIVRCGFKNRELGGKWGAAKRELGLRGSRRMNCLSSEAWRLVSIINPPNA